MSECYDLTTLQTCSVPASYIRPDKGSVVIPWIILLALVLANVASILIRCFSKWESSQLLSISLALFGVVTTSLSYSSTQFDPEQIYTWSPLGLGLDVSSILHLMILVWDYELRTPKKEERPETRAHELTGLMEDRQAGSQANKEDYQKGIGCILTFVILSILALALIGLQVAGAVEALARKHGSLTETWCSPALLIGNVTFTPPPQCLNFAINARSAMGMSCIEAPGNQQTYLSLTGGIVLLQVLLEFGDCWLIFSRPRPAYKHKSHGFREKYTAPWISIAVALIVSAGMVGYSVMQTTAMPSGVPQGAIGIVSQMEGICQTSLTPGGLRGTIIAWCDGVFGAFGKAYSNPPI
jgi:hypothetical protein